ncbi:MAG: Hsp20/alpha crystallin family protein, partial [Nitrospirae bacterium]|nr:Hsp20/alpha crystallin family protein [Nitrospirota bacterium]
KAEVPGMSKEDIELTITGDTLTIRGEKKKEEKIEEKDYYYSERSVGSISRTVELPVEVAADKVNAILKNGVLEIRLPKLESSKRKEIKVKVE